MNSNKKITVVVPTFNEEKSIKKLLDTLVNQTHKIDEIIISDANSKDNTISIIKSYIKFGHNIKLANRVGICRGAGRNSGIYEASNDIVALIDAGSFPQNNWLEKLLEKYRNKFSIVFGSVKPIYNNLLDYCLSVLIIGKKNKEELIYPSVSSMILNKYSWNNLGRFKESNDGSYIVEDLLFIDKIKSSSFDIFFNNEAIVNWNVSMNYFEIIKRFSEYSQGGLKSGYARNWHLGIFKNFLLLILILISSYYIIWFILLIIPAILLRSYSYLRKNNFFKKFNFFKKIACIFLFAYVLIITDIATIIGLINWIVKFKR